MRNTLRSLILIPLLAGIGCGNFFVSPGTSGTVAATTTSFAYVANATAGTVSGFALATGALVAVANSPYPIPLSPNSLVVTPSNTFLYLGCLGAIYGYSIGTAGQLTALNSGSALAAVPVVSMDVSPDGAWLFALDAGGTRVDEYAIDTATGALTVQDGASFTVTGGITLPRMVRVAPNGAYIVAAMGTGGDIIFTFNTTTGVLAQSQSLAGSSTTSDNAVAFDANSAYLYIARSGSGSGLAVFSVGAAGALTSVAGSPFAAGAAPYSVVLNASGTYAYVANRTDGTITGYSIATGGLLTVLTSAPYTSGLLVTSLGRDSTAKYLLAASFGGSPDLTMYTFDTATPGKLDSASTSTTGTDPTGAVAVALTH